MQASAYAIEQGEAELVLGLLQGLARRRLRNVQQVRRAVKGVLGLHNL
jgi:hypothetical protein